MSWHARLQLDYRRADNGTTVVQHHHNGPLRVFKSLYPEGPGICHNVIVHPPGGLVQGDCLDIDIEVHNGAHALISTPGATRFYRSPDQWATQNVQIRLHQGSRCEWLPLETIAYPACRARNHLTMSLADGAELMTWEVLCLGLPGASQNYARGVFEQMMAWPGVWLDRAHLNADDHRMLQGPLGLDGRSTLATLVLACGSPMTRERKELLLQAVRQVIDAHPMAARCGATCPNDRVLVVRALADSAEEIQGLWQALWAVLRTEAWKLSGSPPRIWKV